MQIDLGKPQSLTILPSEKMPFLDDDAVPMSEKIKNFPVCENCAQVQLDKGSECFFLTVLTEPVLKARKRQPAGKERWEPGPILQSVGAQGQNSRGPPLKPVVDTNKKL